MAPSQATRPPEASTAKPPGGQSLQYGNYCDYYDLTWPSGWQSREVLYHSHEEYSDQSWLARLRRGTIYAIRQLLLTVLALTASVVLVGSQLSRLHRLSSGILKATSLKSIGTTRIPTALSKERASSPTQRSQLTGPVSTPSKQLPLDIALVTRDPAQTKGPPQYIQMQLVRHRPGMVSKGAKGDAQGNGDLLPITAVQAINPLDAPDASSVRPVPPEALVTTDNHGHRVVTEYIDIPPRYAARIHCVSAPASRRASTSHEDLVVANHDATTSYVLEQSYDISDHKSRKSRSGRRRLRATSLLKPKLSHRDHKEQRPQRSNPQSNASLRHLQPSLDQSATRGDAHESPSNDDQLPDGRSSDLGLPTKLLSDGIKNTKGLLGKLGRLSLGGIHGPGNGSSNGGHREGDSVNNDPSLLPNEPREPTSVDRARLTRAGLPPPPPPSYAPPGADPSTSSRNSWSLSQQPSIAATNHAVNSDTGAAHASYPHPPPPMASVGTGSYTAHHALPSWTNDTSSPIAPSLSTASNSTRPLNDDSSLLESGHPLEPRTYSWANGGQGVTQNEDETKHRRLANFHHQHRHHQRGSSTASYQCSDDVEGEFVDGDQHHYPLHHRLLGHDDSHRNRLRRRVKGLFKNTGENSPSPLPKSTHDPSETSGTSSKSADHHLRQYSLPLHYKAQSDETATTAAAPATVERSSSLGAPRRQQMH
ncbi:hypothetical protein H4R34_001039 [Dimargaris verticillata]|uniref:Uncharacterized protein n=1 Tax=Dimargaris verticillata TaxID=2761393 RepID=A0A9W8EFC1_9FUNG|nr:hypothetical protein H4R34_001039 [Dimargaris verticillata]